MRFAKYVGWLLLLTACHDKHPDPNARTAAAANAESAVSADRQLLWAAEQRRDSAAIASEILSSRDVAVRRSAARALARIADARAAELLLLALADEDPEVNTWAAYGLGYACRGREPKTVRALVARAASLHTESARLLFESPDEAIADALGRCANAEAESTLRAWLRGPSLRAEAAALALGRLATQTGKLDDLTVVALLDSADHAPRLQNALFPLTRLATLNVSSAERTRKLASGAIAARTPEANIEFAVRVLGRTGKAGFEALATLAAQRDLPAKLRAQALRELGTQGEAGQKPLWTAFDQLLEILPTDALLDSDEYGPIATLVDALSPPILGSGSKLRALAELPILESDSVTIKRRKVHLRCTAAALLAGSNYQSARLLACDPAQDSAERELFVLRVLGREKLRGARKKAYLHSAHADDALLREAAIDRLAEHPELSEAYAVLADALGAKALGVVASAAHLLSSYPERAARTVDEGGDAHAAPKPDPSVIQALTLAYAAASARYSIEVQSALLDAIGALQILSLKDSANGACSSDNPTLREHAQKALRLLGEQARRCDDFKPSRAALPTAASAGFSRLELTTEAGPLAIQLDAAQAPVAVARVLALAQSGFYDGMAIHRVVPGFVAQFGDPGGDGYGGDDQPPLRCETSPIEFGSGMVGVALSGRDTGSSQLFVTLGRYPHLDGQYAWVGSAGGDWTKVAAGDRILHVRVTSPWVP